MPTFKLLRKISKSDGTSRYVVIEEGLTEEEAFNKAGASSGESELTDEADLITQQDEE